MTELKESFATSSGHWYALDGTPYYTIVGKNGKERNTTLRDARAHNLVPSVTSILKVLASPGLEQWKQKQLLEAALTLPKIEGEGLDQYSQRVIADSQEQAAKARDKGTEIHGELEKYYRGEKVFYYTQEVEAVAEAVKKEFGDQEWQAERSFACKLGYGGKIDLHSQYVVIDFKTKEFDDPKQVKCYDEHYMQLSAYRYGLGVHDAVCANVFVSTTVPWLVHIVEHSIEESRRGFEMFRLALQLWQLQKDYFPGGN